MTINIGVPQNTRVVHVLYMTINIGVPQNTRVVYDN
jgi:hypothetical protein